jgi:putative membrane protein
MMGWYGGGGWWGVGMIAMLLFWVVVIGAIIWAAVRLTNRPQPPAPPVEPAQSPRQILDRRFASGELSEQQYVDARRLLEIDPTTARP